MLLKQHTVPSTISIIIKIQKIIILNIYSYQKQKNKFYVVKTTYGPSTISIIIKNIKNIKNTKNNYTQYSQLSKKKINPMLLKQHTLKSILCIIYL